MRRIIGAIGATLVVVAAMATSATPASAACQGPGTWSVLILPYIEQDSVYRQHLD